MKRRKKILIWGLVVLVGGVVSSTIYYLFFFDIGIAARQYESHRATLKTLGYFETEAEFRKEIGLDDPTNIGSKVSDWPDFEKDLKELESYSTAKICTFDSSSPFSPMASDRLPEMRLLGKSLSTRAHKEWLAGNRTFALRCWSAAATVAKWADQHAMKIHVLVRLSIEQYIHDSLRDAFVSSPVTEQDHAAILRILDRLDERVSLEKMLRCEYWFGAQSVTKATKEDIAQTLKEAGLPESRANWPLYQQALQARFAEGQVTFERELAANDSQTLLSHFQAAEKYEEFFEEPGPSYQHFASLISGPGSVVRAMANFNSQRSVLRRAMAAMLSSDRSTKFPLPAQYQLDGFEGALQFKQIDTKRIIYSVGMNDVDDGGISEESVPGKDDFAVIIP